MNKYDFQGKNVVVTGGARGIGRETTILFLKNGANVAICGRSARDAEALIAEIAEAAGVPADRLMYGACDVSSVADVEKFLDSAAAHFGPIDVLVNNAGIWQATPVTTITEEDFDRNVTINLKSQVFASEWFGKHRRENGGNGAIVNISSISAALTNPNTTIYNMCKAATNSITRSYAHGFGDINVRVNAVGPGTIPTDINAATYADPAVEKKMCDSLVLGRRGKREEIANTVLFLASEDAGYITGQIIYVDGGWLLQSSPTK